jgi:hypothetical protein
MMSLDCRSRFSHGLSPDLVPIPRQ